jgi:selenocysteine lyase/cysteine desulfurase
MTNVDLIATILHQSGALAFFDYATAAPHVKVIYVHYWCFPTDFVAFD